MSLAPAILATWLTGIVVVPTIAAAQSRLPQCPKIWLRGWTNCQGTFTFANGDKYVGEFRDGKYHGQGTATYADGGKYIGEFKDGNKNGQGTLHGCRWHRIRRGMEEWQGKRSRHTFIRAFPGR
jgi:hypothetical protein